MHDWKGFQKDYFWELGCDFEEDESVCVGKKRYFGGCCLEGMSSGFRVDSGSCFGTHIRDCLLIFTGYSPRNWENEYIPTLLNMEKQIGSRTGSGKEISRCEKTMSRERKRERLRIKERPHLKLVFSRIAAPLEKRKITFSGAGEGAVAPSRGFPEVQSHRWKTREELVALHPSYFDSVTAG